MSKWELFEKDCAFYLNNKFGNYAEFVNVGGSDSTKSDIIVNCKNGRVFYIEVKFSPAQAGQFVLLRDLKNQSFIYSPENKESIHSSTIDIIEYMNRHFLDFCNAGTGGTEIKITNGEEIFADWIISHYLAKNAKFVISKGYVILPTEDFRKYFKITAVYRVKRSGSRKISHKYIPSALREIKNHGIHLIAHFETSNALLIKCRDDIDKKRFYINDQEFYITKHKEPDTYTVRQLSNTYNANVIFSVTLKKHQGISDSEFIRSLT